MVVSWSRLAVGTAALVSGLALAGSASAQQTDWTFAYAGAHLGYDWTDFNADGFGSLDADGIAGGVLAGINFYQSRNVVLGVEADVTWFDVDANKTMSFSGQCESRLSDTQSVGAGVNWKATLRGRAGYLFNPTTLVYGTAGAAWANVSLSESSTTFPNCEEPVVAGGAADKTFFGGVFGGGVETHFNSSLLGRVEVLHFVFDDETVSVGGTPVSFDLDETIVRVALSIKLN